MNFSKELDKKTQTLFKTGEWKFRKIELEEDEDLTKDIFSEPINNYQSEPFLNKKLVKAYLGQSINYFYYQDYLTFFFYNLSQEEFIRLIKFNKLFDADFFEDFIKPIKSSGKIKNLLKELEIIKKENEKTKKLTEEIKSQLSEYEFFQLLFNLAVWNDYHYLEQLKINPENTAIDPYKTQAISFVIKLKKENKLSYQDNKDFTPKQLQKMFLVFLKRFAENRNDWLPFEALMSKVYEIIKWDDIKGAYLYQNAKLKILNKNKWTILPSNFEDEYIWKKTGELQRYLERFYSIESRNLNSYHFVELYYNGIPQEIEYDNIKINTYHVLSFFEGLKDFHTSRYYEMFKYFSLEYPNENIFQIIDRAIRSGNLWVKPMMGVINITDVDFLINRVIGKIPFTEKIDIEQIKNIFKFVIYDLNTEDTDDFFNILEQPFLLLGKHLYYFTTVFTANNPAFILENRILKQSNEIKKQYEEIISKQFEKVIADIFLRAGFQTKIGVNIPENGNNPKTDIDVMVWKDNEILVVQAKKTYRRLKVSEIENYSDTFEKASRQAEVSIEYIKNNSDKFLKQNKIDFDYKKIKVSGLIVSNTPEGNFKKYGKNKYNKVTAAELEIILQDKKNFIIDWNLEALSIHLKSKKKAIEMIKSLNFYQMQEVHRKVYKKLNKIAKSIKYWEINEKTISKLMYAIDTNYLWKEL